MHVAQRHDEYKRSLRRERFNRNIEAWIIACPCCNGTMRSDIATRCSFLTSILCIGGPTGIFFDRIINFLFHYYINTRAYKAAYFSLMDQARRSTEELVLLSQISATANALHKQGIKEDAILKTCLALSRPSAFVTAIVRGGINSIHKAANAVPDRYLIQRAHFVARESDVVSTITYDDTNIGRLGYVEILRELSAIQATTGAFIQTNPGAQLQVAQHRGMGIDAGWSTAHGMPFPVFATYTGDPIRDDHALILERQDVDKAYKNTMTEAAKGLPFIGRWKARAAKRRWLQEYVKKTYPYPNDFFETHVDLVGESARDRAFYIQESELPVTTRFINRLKRWWYKVPTLYQVTALNTAPVLRTFQPKNDDGTFMTRKRFIYNINFDKTMSEIFEIDEEDDQEPPKLPPPPENFENFSVESDTESSGDNSGIDDDFVNPTNNPTKTPFQPKRIPSPLSFPVNVAPTKSKAKKDFKPREKTDWQKMIARATEINVARGQTTNACYACCELNAMLGTDFKVDHVTSECTRFKLRGNRWLHPIHTGCWGCDEEEMCGEHHDNDEFVMRMAAWSLRNPRTFSDETVL